MDPQGTGRNPLPDCPQSPNSAASRSSTDSSDGWIPVSADDDLNSYVLVTADEVREADGSASGASTMGSPPGDGQQPCEFISVILSILV